MTLTEQIKYRSKAIITACGAIVQTAVVTLILDPDTEAAIVKVIPVQYQVLASLVLGAIITAVVHKVPIVKPAEAPIVEPPTDTTIVRLSAVNGGEFTGTPAH